MLPVRFSIVRLKFFVGEGNDDKEEYHGAPYIQNNFEKQKKKKA